ncbi:unnamed protein product [Lathyrus oleraceus]|uniref:Hydroxyproline-rich glycoprotein family protein n=1 Tax=Pisum sativum TaxID=3888 RepID=A0A9D4WLZ5_PEA|nr:uncharacterized protein LOC127087825 [Pisum sativum]KAI5403908.1 hypothetical protein KIW84_051163 [Pisum sativum]
MELDNLVKQLSTSRPKDQNCVFKDGVSVDQNLSKNNKVVDAHKAQPQQHKKQVRRRLHTTKPYQERLMNMAEARREIVTALKFHRASMKEASEQQKKQKQQQEAQEQMQKESLSHQSSQHQSFEQDGRYNKSRRNHRIYPSCRTNSSYLSVPNSYTWPSASPILSPPPTTLLPENPNFILPNQTLGLNLNFHDFNNLDITVHLNNNSSSSSSPSSYSSGTSSSSASQDVPSVGTSQVDRSSSATGGLHTVMNDEAMAEIRSLGDQHQMEWNDTMSLVKSACWFKYLKHMEHGAPAPAPETKVENDGYRDFEQPLEFPAWLNANESCLELCSENSFQDSTLPCMDIGEIDCMDDDWLAG